jgi:hypothetical protein
MNGASPTSPRAPAPSDAATVGQVTSLQAQIEDLRRECGLPARTARANTE